MRSLYWRTKDVCVAAELMDGRGRREVVVGLSASRVHVDDLAEMLLGRPATDDQLAKEAFAELVLAIAGRVQVSLAESGVRIEQHGSRIPTNPRHAETKWDVSVGCRTATGQQVTLAIGVQEQRRAVRADRAQSPSAFVPVRPTELVGVEHRLLAQPREHL